MAQDKIHLAFLWHMHQPFYKDLVTKEYMLPWVRLHTIKDYYQMAVLAQKFPNIKQTFNFVPSLLEQIEDINKGNIKDKYLQLSQKDANDLTEDERVFILNNFFMSNWPTMIAVYPRYWNLLLKRGRFSKEEDLKRIQKGFTVEDIRDVQAWFNLSWFSAYTKSEDSQIKELIKKDRDYSEDDKKVIINKQNEIISKVIDMYKSLWAKQQIEISTSPFYHPILPLLCDTNIASQSWPDIALPENRFSHRDDADKQIQMALEYFEDKFNKIPSGMWPSEGSISDEVVELLCQHGFKWTATDEGILQRSIKEKGPMSIRALSSEELFQPYYMERNNHKLGIIFRDQKISNKLSFVYSKWNKNRSVNDFIGTINHIRTSLPTTVDREFLVSVIMDGENAWEFYDNNGWPFLNLLFERLSSDNRIVTTTVQDYMKNQPPTKEIKNIFPGSWINSNYNVWIGHNEDNLSWDYLGQARDLVEKVSQGKGNSSLEKLSPTEKEARLKLAWQEIYVAEGSDWNWWYGEDHSSANDKEFDMLYRRHLMNIYQLIGLEVPKHLYVAIKKLGRVKPKVEPVQFINPVIDGKSGSYYEWLSAGYYQIGQGGSAIHYSRPIVKGIHYGFNLLRMFFRIDFDDKVFCENKDKIKIIFQQLKPTQHKIEITFEEKKPKGNILNKTDDEWQQYEIVNEIALDDVFEMGVSFDKMRCKPDDEINIIVMVLIEDKEIERYPLNGVISFIVPNEEYETDKWYV